VIYPPIGNFTLSKKKYTFGGQKSEKRRKKAPRAQKRNLGPKINMIVWYIHRLGILHGARKNILLGVKKADIGPRAQKRNLGPKINMVVWYIHLSGILHGVRKYILLGVKKALIGPQSPKMEFGAQNQYGRVIYPSIGNFTWSKKKHTFGQNKVSEPEKGTQAKNKKKKK
jgi:hypothetical protein